MTIYKNYNEFENAVAIALREAAANRNISANELPDVGELINAIMQDGDPADAAQFGEFASEEAYVTRFCRAKSFFLHRAGISGDSTRRVDIELDVTNLCDDENGVDVYIIDDVSVKG